jgi:hypothetical protein
MHVGFRAKCPVLILSKTGMNIQVVNLPIFQYYKNLFSRHKLLHADRQTGRYVETSSSMALQPDVGPWPPLSSLMLKPVGTFLQIFIVYAPKAEFNVHYLSFTAYETLLSTM